MKQYGRLLCLLLIGLSAGFGCATLGEGVFGEGGARDSTPEEGVREALRVSTQRAIEQLARPGGYALDPMLRIPVPDELEGIARGLRAIGLGSVVDEFEASLNRAAEKAAPLAKPVFLDAIRGMTFRDAMRIVRGDGHEATDYFELTSSARLETRFRPQVAEALNEVGATRELDELMRKAATLAFRDRPPIDLADYVTEKAVDGLFDALGREELEIRENPTARTTKLLERWFTS